MKEQQSDREDQVIVQLAAFSVGGQQYVIDIMRIREIIKLMPVTPVPADADVIEGVINLRGVIIPVVDLRKRLAVPRQQQVAQAKIIVVMLQDSIFGLIVDEVLDVVRISRGAIKPAPAMASRGSGSQVLGVCEHQGRLLMLLNLHQILKPVVDAEAGRQDRDEGK